MNQGKGSSLSIGSETLVRAIEKAAKDNSVKAIVLRVNSPGGDAIASELITNEVIKAKKLKPVIVSMGDVAASAGYEMSSNASLIVASPITITGSIGVFGIMPNIARSLKNNVGLTFDTVKTNDNAIMSLTTPRSQQSKLILQMNVENFYDNFITRVAEGRKLEKTYVDSIARGRVWSALDAKELGLVDEFGGLNKAISIAAKKAGIEQYGIVAYPKQKDIFTKQERLEIYKMMKDEFLISDEMKSHFGVFGYFKFIVETFSEVLCYTLDAFGGTICYLCHNSTL